MTELYRGYLIHYDPAPISTPFDYRFVHQDYDGPGDGRCGCSPSIEAAKSRIDDIETMREDR